MIHDMIAHYSIDICAITETWLSGDHRDHHTLADLKNTLPNFQFYHIPRMNRAGGGVLVYLRKGFHVRRHEVLVYDAFEHIDLSINSSSNEPLRLMVVYRLLNKKHTATLFMQEFSSLLEHIAHDANHMIAGDFNFHIDNRSDREALTFCELLESTGLKQHVSGPYTGSSFNKVFGLFYLPLDHM